MTAAAEPSPLLNDLKAALKAVAPFALESARHHERLGLIEEAARAWSAYRQAQWALRAAGDPNAEGGHAAVVVDYQD